MGLTLAVYIQGVYTEDMNKESLLANLTLAQMIEHHATLDNKEAKTAEDRMVAAWLADEIERRVPALDSALDRIFSDDNFAGTYSDALRLAYAEVTA